MKKSILFTLLLISAISFSSCRKTIHGSGHYVSQSRTVLPFNTIQSDGDFQIVLTEDSIFDVTIHAEDNILPEIVSDVTGGKLHIYYDNNNIHIDNGPVTVYINAPEIIDFGLHGSGNLLTTNILHSTSMRVHISGSGTIDMAIESPSLNSEISGSGKISLMGIAELASHKISGSGKLKGYTLESEFVNAEVSGSGNCYVTVNQVLDATVSGSGSIRYRGNPIVHSHISGSGSIRPE